MFLLATMPTCAQTRGARPTRPARGQVVDSAPGQAGMLHRLRRGAPDPVDVHPARCRSKTAASSRFPHPSLPTPSRVFDLPADTATSSPIVSDATLLAYRAASLTLALTVGVTQFRRAPHTLAYYTVWSWWVLTLYFACATAASARAVLASRRAAGSRTTAAPATARLAPLGAATVALFHVALPSSLIVVAVTWTVLYPMLAASPDVKVRETARRNFKTTQSYIQHGGNALLAVGDLALNSIPPVPYLMSLLGAYSSTFGVWALAFYRRTGRFLYPFLDTRRKGAALVYVGLYISHWAFFAIALLLFKARDAAVGAAVGDSGRGRKKVV